MISVMNVQKQNNRIAEDLDSVVLEVLHSGKYILGDSVSRFEREFAEYCGVKYAIGVGNGTDALVIALKALGISEGDEVITAGMSFFATAEAIASVGATPVFVDCRKDTFLIDAELIEEKITSRTRAIIPVHLYGQCADMDRIKNICKNKNIKIIEDFAQAAGASYKGQRAGSMGDVGCTSFFPTKNLGCAGDGGMITTNDEAVYKNVLALRVHGSGNNGLFMYRMNNKLPEDTVFDFGNYLPKYFNFVLGYNSRLDAMQAAILSVKLKYLDEWNKRRTEIAKCYYEGINNRKVSLPYVEEENVHSYYVFPLIVEDRDKFREFLLSQGVETGVYFPVPLHLQKAFESLNYKEGDLPVAEFMASNVVVIPMYPELEQSEIEKVISAVNAYS